MSGGQGGEGSETTLRRISAVCEDTQVSPTSHLSRDFLEISTGGQAWLVDDWRVRQVCKRRKSDCVWHQRRESGDEKQQGSTPFATARVALQYDDSSASWMPQRADAVEEWGGARRF
jgi:hypothetical protein